MKFSRHTLFDIMIYGGLGITAFGLYQYHPMLGLAYGGHVLSIIGKTLYSMMYSPMAQLQNMYQLAPQGSNPASEEKTETKEHHGQYA